MKRKILNLLSLFLCFSLLSLSSCKNADNDQAAPSTNTVKNEQTSDTISRGEALLSEEIPFEDAVYTTNGIYPFQNDPNPSLVFDKAMGLYGEKSINIIGDSISNGLSSGAIYNNSWVSLFKNSVNHYFNTYNWGYTTLANGSTTTTPICTELHTVEPESGSWSNLPGSSNTPGFQAWRSGSGTASTLKISLDRKKDSYDRHINGFYVYYAEAPASGAFTVTVNGKKVASIPRGTKVDNCARTPYIPIPEDAGRELEIRIVKSDANLVVITGVSYVEKQGGIVINNYSGASQKLCETNSNLLQNLCKANYVILALGYNDAESSQNINLFKAKLLDISTACLEYGTKLIVVDFMWDKVESESWANPYKAALFDCAASANGYYLDFSHLEDVDRNYLLADSVHPTSAGHKLIARRLCYFFGVPFTSNFE